MKSLLRSLKVTDEVIRCSLLVCTLVLTSAPYKETTGQETDPSADTTTPDDQPDSSSEPVPDEDDESYGEAPEDNSYVFLRRISPLLKPGDCQTDVGLAYTLYHADLPVLIDRTPDPDLVQDARIVMRAMTVPFSVRYGLSKDLQLFLNVPLSWNNTEVAYGGRDSFDNAVGVGGVTLGGTCLLNNPTGNETMVIGSTGVTIPIGNGLLATDPLDSRARLGSGHYAVGTDLVAIQTFDPVIVYYGVGMVKRLSNEFDGRKFNVQPGMEFRYRFGVGFAVNERLTLSSSLFGSHRRDTTVNDIRFVGSMREPVHLRIAATMAGKDRIQEPFVEFGLTDDSTNVSFGWVYTF